MVSFHIEDGAPILPEFQAATGNAALPYLNWRRALQLLAKMQAETWHESLQVRKPR